MARTKFKFNLLPKVSQLEAELEEERDDSTFSALILLIVSVLVFVVLSLVSGLFITPQIEEAEERKLELEQQKATYNPVLERNGELVVKSQALQPLLAKGLNFEEIFTVSDALLASQYAIEIAEYSRESEGQFVYSVGVTNMEDVPDFITEVKNIELIDRLEVRSTSRSEQGVRMILGITIPGA